MSRVDKGGTKFKPVLAKRKHPGPPSQRVTATPTPFQSSQRPTPAPSISHHVVTESEKEDEDDYVLNDSHNESGLGHNPAIAPSSGIPTVLASARKPSPLPLTQRQALSALSSHTSPGIPLVMSSSSAPSTVNPPRTRRPTEVTVPTPSQAPRPVSITAPSSSQTKPSVPITFPQRDFTPSQPPPAAPYVQQPTPSIYQVDPGTSTATGQPGEVAVVSQPKSPLSRKRVTTTENELPRPKRRRTAVAKPRARKKVSRATSESDSLVETEAEADSDEERTPHFRSKRNSKPKAPKRQGLPARPLEDDTDNASSDKSPRHRRTRKPHPRVDKPVTEMPEVGESIDETTVTMNDLCNGLGQGHVSSRFLDVFQLSAVNRKRKREDRAKLTDIVRRRELGLPQEEGDDMIGQRGRGLTAADLFGAAVVHGAGAEEEESGENEDDYVMRATAVRHAPQIRYDAHGNMVLDEERLDFDRQAEAEEELAAQGPVEVIVENDRDKFTNHATFSRKPGYSRWSREETELFYDALRRYHMNFDLIARVIPGRTRTMIKNKFKLEDKHNSAYITKLLSVEMRLPIDTAELGRATGRDFSGPLPEVAAPGPPVQALPQPENDRANSTAPSTDAKSGDEEIDQLPGESNPVRSRSSARGKAKRVSRSRSLGNRSTTVSQVVESHQGPPAIVSAASLNRRSASPLPLDEIRRSSTASRPRPAGNALLLGYGGRAPTRGTDGE